MPISMTAEQDGKIGEAARAIGLSKQDTIRLSIDRGLPVLIAQLTQTGQAA